MSNQTSSLPLLPLTQNLLKALDERSSDIMRRRYGIKTPEVETLESIGKEYGITRERVRQIEAQAKKMLMGMEASLQPVALAFAHIFQAHGGLLADDHVVLTARHVFGAVLSPAHIYLYLEILPGYKHVSYDPHFNPHWRSVTGSTVKATATVAAARAILAQAQHPIAQDKLLEQIMIALKEGPASLNQQHVLTFLTASKHIAKTPFGEWGLVAWPETSPRGVGDKAYAVLRRHGKPEHFTRITDLINEAQFDHKRANPQTVHNELIKDKRFVLVGRGLYGLTEWGYIPGTVADVLESLLKRTERGLTREELIAQVLEQRQVKKNTILLGLQNEQRFVKTPENRYVLRQK